MKVRLDQGLPAGLAPALAGLGHDVDTVPPGGGSDAEVWAAAQRDGRFLVTQTLDVSDPARFAPGTHRGLLLVRLREPGRKALSEHVQILFETEEVARWAACCVVSTERKLRIRSSRKSPGRWKISGLSQTQPARNEQLAEIRRGPCNRIQDSSPP